MRDEDQKRVEVIVGKENYYRSILDNMHDVILVIDRNYRIVDLNMAACATYKGKREDIIGRYCYEVSHMYDKPCSELVEQCPLLWVKQTEQPVQVFHQHKLPDGTLLWEDILASPMKDSQGRVVCVIEAMRDVTALQTMQQRLHITLTGVIHSLATIVEMRDPYTAGHQRRVAQLACAIPRKMGFPEDQIEAIRMAALLHDIGKISVPTDILSKPGRISESEFNIIKNHPQVSYEILKEIEFEWPIAQIVLQHHERMDGSGYPQGLSDGDILFEARILGVADVIEAMSSRRPYRPALGIDKALKEISQHRGVLYDPEVVDVCLKLFAEKEFKFD
jgi:PAS domain S-box-containing protein/putative nucleotidyltransferase with HDIG domain